MLYDAGKLVFIEQASACRQSGERPAAKKYGVFISANFEIIVILTQKLSKALTFFTQCVILE